MKISINFSFRHLFQKLFRGYSDAELWDLEATLYLWLYPRLKAFRRMKRIGVPMGYTERNWEEFLKKSQKALERYLSGNGYRGFKKPVKYDYKQIEADCKELLANIDLLWD